MIVVDASVAVKLFRDEVHSELAIALFKDHAGTLIAPDIFAVEVASAFVREANITKDDAAIVDERLSALSDLLNSATLRLVRTTPDVIMNLARIAIELGHPLKDCIYLALAMSRDYPLVTADERFAEKALGLYGAVEILGAKR